MFPAIVGIAFLTACNALPVWLRSHRRHNGTYAVAGTARLSATMPSTVAANLGMTLFAAGSVLSTVPPLILALLVQHYITRLNVADPMTPQDD
jgi:ABC-type maltose transport system permease subunit